MREVGHLVIVGGGFSGVALAAELARRDAGVRITIVEAGTRLGRGVAYGTSNPSHLLNTRADQMGLFADDPAHFLRWLRTRGRAAHGGDFVPRHLYGEYLEETLLAVCTGTSRARLVVELAARATAVTRSTGAAVATDKLAVTLSDGRTLVADAVVLATGHPAPADPFGGTLDGARCYLRDPWRADAIAGISREEQVLVIGTGLTAVDAVLALEAQGHRGPIHAVSRHGLLPRPHSARREMLPGDLQSALRIGCALGDLRTMVETLRRTIAAAAERGMGWQAVFDALRPMVPSVWADLCPRDRQRFVHSIRPFWDVHRHRLPHGQASRVAALQARGRLSVRAAHLLHAVNDGDSIAVDYALRGAGRAVRERYEWVINCTGSSFARQSRPPLEQDLVARGALLPDPLGLGYVTAANGSVVGAHGPVRQLYLIGPACRPYFWEHTAVPELRAQAAALAAELLQDEARLAIASRSSSLRPSAAATH
jgi:uncharacterized NAD(P)/FAD-binding protein YdhS